MTSRALVGLPSNYKELEAEFERIEQHELVTCSSYDYVRDSSISPKTPPPRDRKPETPEPEVRDIASIPETVEDGQQSGSSAGGVEQGTSVEDKSYRKKVSRWLYDTKVPGTMNDRDDPQGPKIHSRSSSSLPQIDALSSGDEFQPSTSGLSSSTLTRADVLTKRRERIKTSQSLLEDRCRGGTLKVVTGSFKRIKKASSLPERLSLSTPESIDLKRDSKGRFKSGLQDLDNARRDSSQNVDVEAPRPLLASTEEAGPSRSLVAGNPTAAAGLEVASPSFHPRTSNLAQTTHQVPSGTGMVQRTPLGHFHMTSMGVVSTERGSSHSAGVSRMSVTGSSLLKRLVVRYGQGNHCLKERVLMSGAPSEIEALSNLSQSCASTSLSLVAPRDQSGAPTGPETTAGDTFAHLLGMCGQERPLTFEDALQLVDLTKCSKAGEGSHGDVFVVVREQERSVVKVIPIDVEKANEPGSTASQGILELVICRSLSDLRFNLVNSCSTFIELKGAFVVRGPYHPTFLACWKKYDARWCSGNPNPETFDDDQKYLLLECAFGGKTLDGFMCDPSQAESVFVQVSCALAVAEAHTEFEHRDLHCDNVLVRPCPARTLQFTLGGRAVGVPSRGIEVSIIDFDLSRMQYGGSVVFMDLSKDSAQFRGTGSLQYDVYRSMKRHNGNNWEPYCPRSNILWLNYLLGKLIGKCGKRKSKATAQLIDWHAAILESHSASQFVADHVVPKFDVAEDVVPTAWSLRPRIPKV
ncbi:hypothetical protein HPB47_014712 [Ixodes persulcatus]|uniref:Uncharacterized protein n=1 Tax=Ixodes persulcatus TaxID=34615 RepID=A0AC60QVB2_IXOPE|nr:hypothetical protein HPB47_014712 [Ixodes persulcatus]